MYRLEHRADLPSRVHQIHSSPSSFMAGANAYYAWRLAAGHLQKDTATEHTTSAASTATKHARRCQMAPPIGRKRSGCDNEDEPDSQKSSKRLKPTPPSTPVPRCQHCGRVSFDVVKRTCKDTERNILKPGTLRVCRLCNAFFVGLDMLQAVGENMQPAAYEAMLQQVFCSFAWPYVVQEGLDAPPLARH